MTTTPSPSEFKDSDVMPSGRKAREVPDGLLTALADSAKRGIAKVREAAPAVIDELRKDLGSAKVRAAYIVTQETVKVNETLHRLRFSAVAKDEATTKPADTSSK